MEIVIQSGIPIPAYNRGGRGRKKGPYRIAFEAMKAGDSFAVPDRKTAHSLLASVNKYRDKTNVFAVSRRMPDGSHQIWKLVSLDA